MRYPRGEGELPGPLLHDDRRSREAALNLPEKLYLLLANPADGDTGTLEWTPIKRALQGAYAWELVRTGAVRLTDNQAWWAGTADPDLEAVTWWHRDQSGAFSMAQLCNFCDAAQGLLSAHLARNLTRLGFFDEKSVTHLLVFHKTIHPRNARGDAEAQGVQAGLMKALHTLKQHEVGENEADAVGAMLLDISGTIRKALPDVGKGRQLDSASYQLLVESGLVPRPLLAQYGTISQADDLNSLLGFLDIFT